MEGLMKKDLVCEKGRSDAVGRPILYGTTNVFLQNFGFESLKDLPDIEDIETLVSGYLADDAEEEAQRLQDGQMQIDMTN
jgi:segregation and condensation protein B